MISGISCPHCALPIDPQARFCEHCGVNVALAAAVAERDVIAPAPSGSEIPLAPEMLVPRMGETLIEKGVLRPADLQRALDYQQAKARDGAPVLLGKALLELELVDRETLDQVITVQILRLQTALSDANRQLEERVQERTRDLQQALARLAELNQLKSNFIANVSHELRTPLTHIKGYLDILADGSLGEVSAQQADAFAVIQRAEKRLEQLIEDLIQFSLASRGEISLNLEVVDLRRILDGVRPQAERRAQQTGLELRPSIPEQPLRVHVDPEKTSWVLLQLLDNAFKFTSSGGWVELGAHPDELAAQVWVSDSGIGIPADRIAEIFEPFHQLDGSATRRFGGTGLGLAMARKILDAHGIPMLVQSELGKGSRFEFSLPLLQETEESRILKRSQNE